MTREDKQLILKDLCCRLPYGVKCENFNHVYGKNIFKVTDIRDNGYICGIINNQYSWAVLDTIELKPYLFPLSRMTEEQKEELDKITYGSVSINKDFFYDLYNCSKISTGDIINVIDWLNRNHIDYRGLIPVGLAIDATNLNVYSKEE